MEKCPQDFYQLIYDGQELSGGNLSWMTSGYKKNKELVQKMIELLPEQFQQIPIGQKRKRGRPSKAKKALIKQ